MKTEQYYTKRKLDENILGFINHIRDFAYNELYDILKKSKNPLIYAVNDNEYALGRYLVIKEQGLWKVMTHLGDVENIFQGKTAALIYAVMLMQNNLNLARKIATADDAMLTSKAELEMYKEKLKLSVKSNDLFKQELYAAKLSVSSFKYTAAKEDLEKTLRTAKYMKLGT